MPDFYQGRVFEHEDDGIAHRDEVGGRELFARVRDRVEDLPAETALMGMSLGAAFAQRLATERPEARAVVLLHHVSPPRNGWASQPVQVHRYADDPFVGAEALRSLGDAVRGSGASFEDLVVPGAGHLFTDPEIQGYDAAATEGTVAAIGRLVGES